MQLHEYQVRVVNSIVNHGTRAVFMEAGLGKTLTTLTALENIYDKWYRVPTLVIAPKIICETVWPVEAEKWGFDITVGQLAGTPAKREKILESLDKDVLCITPELVPWLCAQKNFPFKIVVIDELTKFKSTNSGRWRALKQLFKSRKLLVLGLTGTPAPNGLEDLWAQMYLLDKGATLGVHKTHYLNEYFIDISRDPTRYSQYIPRAGAVERIIDKLKQSGTICLRASDVLGQKEATVLPSIKVPLNKKADKIYNEVVTQSMATLDDGTVVLPSTDTVALQKLRQISSGFIIDEDGEVHHLHNNKVDMLKEYVEELGGSPLMVVFTYRAELEMIRKVFPDAPALAGGVSTKDRQAILKTWNEGNLPILLVQPQAAGHGVNAQSGGNHMLFYSCSYDLELYDQVVARLNRQGQKKEVIIRHMVAGEVEEQIYKKLATKSKLQTKLMVGLS